MKYDVIIVGAGIIGLAAGLKILEKKPGLQILILEKENDIARHQTGNNSGVIHSGIYYKPGSLKAINCIRGYNLLLEFCKKSGINFEVCGKIIVAVSGKELPALDNLYERGIQNGLTGLRKLNREELVEIEPYVNGIAGIFVPQTGIIDYVEVAQKYLEIILNLEGEIKYNQSVIGINVKTNFCEVITQKGNFSASVVVTCAGLYSDRIARMTHPGLPVRIIPFRGEYYKIREEKKYLVNNLIYPVPDASFPFLGVHFTRMIKGEREAGPNAVLAFKREGYSKAGFSFKDIFETLTWRGFGKVIKKNWKTGIGEYYRSFNKKAFVAALQKLVPAVQIDDLVPGGAGVRAQACSSEGGLLDDFYIVEDKRIIHVCNAPSPAATSSLSIGDFISEKTLQKL